MYPISLPAPEIAALPLVRDAQGARTWLAAQPQAQPREMQAALHKALAGLDADDLPVPVRLQCLDTLRHAIVTVQTAAEVRFSRKPLPLAAAEAEAFYAARALWRLLAVAYLRVVPSLPPAQALLPLHRAAAALRQEQYAHFLAGYAVPKALWELLHGVLATATDLGVALTPLADPEYPHLGDAHLAGHIAWGCLLHLADPYRLSLPQLAVANRAFSRWRELAAFRPEPDPDRRARAVPLEHFFGLAEMPAGGPRWMDVRPVARKLRKRIEALEAGETPEALKLGRELSVPACLRLLHHLNEALQPEPGFPSKENGTIELVFEADNLFALLTGEFLHPKAPATPPQPVDYRRLAVFGFDNLATPAAKAARVELPKETWQVEDGYVSRGPGAGGRLLSPCLVAEPAGPGKAARIGVLAGLQMASDGRLRGRLHWFSGSCQGASARIAGAGGKAVRIPVFVLGGEAGDTVLLPASAALRPGSRVTLEGGAQVALVLGEVLERGSDFVRYGVQPA